MAPTLILIRHAQGEHNVSDLKPNDPDLTEEGWRQCATLAKQLQPTLEREFRERPVDLIVVSPLKRCIQTAYGSLGWLIDAGVPIVADADWQETTDKPCDTGSPIPELKALYPQVDFSHLDPTFLDKKSKGSKWKPTQNALLARGQEALQTLRGKKEATIVVVSHSGFMRECVTGCWWHNADYRIFDFDEEESQREGALRLKQWELTAKTHVEKKEETIQNQYEDEEDRELNGGLGVSWAETIRVGDFPAHYPEE